MTVQIEFQNQISIYQTGLYVEEMAVILRCGFALAAPRDSTQRNEIPDSTERLSIVIVSRILGELAESLEELYPEIAPQLVLENLPKTISVPSVSNVGLSEFAQSELLIPLCKILDDIDFRANPISDSNLLYFSRIARVKVDLCCELLSKPNWTQVW